MAAIVRGTGQASVTKTTTGLDLPSAQAVAITDGDGNLMALGANGTLPTSSGSGPNTSLSAAAVTGAGTVTDLGVVRSAHTLQTTVTGAPSGVTVNLEGSLNGSAWVTLVSSTSTTGDINTASGKAVRYVRANLTALTGGTAPTVTALIASAQ